MINDKLFFQKIVNDNLELLYESVSEFIALQNRKGSDFRFVNSFPSPWPYFIYHVSFQSVKPELLVPKLAQLASDKKIPSMWIASPELNISEYNSLLTENGFKLIMKWPGMFCDLTGIDFFNYDLLDIVTITDETLIVPWFKIMERNLFSDKTFPAIYYKLVNQKQFRFFALYKNGNIIGTVLIHITGNVAGCYMVSILKEYRNQGLAFSFLCQIFKKMADENVKYVVLQANAESVSLYRKLGFTVIGDFNIYWKMGVF